MYFHSDITILHKWCLSLNHIVSIYPYIILHCPAMLCLVQLDSKQLNRYSLTFLPFTFVLQQLYIQYIQPHLSVMHQWVTLLVYLMTSSYVCCQNSLFIVGGRDAEVNEFPHMAVIKVSNTFVCGGVYVKEGWLNRCFICIR